nr:hypothetical protein Iba_chr10dCG6590 [Ipomoea batatas]
MGTETGIRLNAVGERDTKRKVIVPTGWKHAELSNDKKRSRAEGFSQDDEMNNGHEGINFYKLLFTSSAGNHDPLLVIQEFWSPCATGKESAGAHCSWSCTTLKRFVETRCIPNQKYTFSTSSLTG